MSSAEIAGYVAAGIALIVLVFALFRSKGKGLVSSATLDAIAVSDNTSGLFAIIEEKPEPVSKKNSKRGSKKKGALSPTQSSRAVAYVSPTPPIIITGTPKPNTSGRAVSVITGYAPSKPNNEGGPNTPKSLWYPRKPKPSWMLQPVYDELSDIDVYRSIRASG